MIQSQEKMHAPVAAVSVTERLNTAGYNITARIRNRGTLINVLHANNISKAQLLMPYTDNLYEFFSGLISSSLSMNYYRLSHQLVTIRRQTKVTSTVTKALISPASYTNISFIVSFNFSMFSTHLKMSEVTGNLLK